MPVPVSNRFGSVLAILSGAVIFLVLWIGIGIARFYNPSDDPVRDFRDAAMVMSAALPFLVSIVTLFRHRLARRSKTVLRRIALVTATAALLAGCYAIWADGIRETLLFVVPVVLCVVGLVMSVWEKEA